LRTNLVVLEDRGVIEATEERHPPHFHVAVLRQAREPRLTFTARTLTPAKDTATKVIASSGGDVAAETKRDSSAESPKRGDNAPTPARYHVHVGDNLWTIARRHHTTPGRLQALNGLRNPTLRPGQTLRLR
jgi:LysM repeat protein